ncbi:MAG: hypothetical protein AAF376_18570 [Pseudomonadota bacterium]
MYEGDSFFTLSAAGQAGLALLSLVFAGLVVGLVRLLGWRRHWAIRVVIAFVVFLGFVWLSPQGYYTYYRLIIDGLPAQSVIREPPRPEDLLALLTFSGRGTLAAHSQGVLGWFMLVAALWGRGRAVRAE